MKRNTYIYSALCLICLLICTFSCTDELGINYVNQTEVKGFALDEAKEFFQNEAGTQTTRSQYSENQKGIYPGDFIPKWETATGSSKNGLACYDIPINADNSFKAVYTEDKYGKLTAQKVNVYQKLVIVKDTKSERMSQYVLTLIPSKAYDNQYGRQVCNKFINCSDKGGFTGIAMYSTVYSNVTIRVNTYKDGIKTQGVSFLNISNAEDWTNKYALVNKILSSVSLQKNKIMTRGEDDFIWDGGYLDEVIITPPSNVGADGMTNEEWLESSRPNNGYVDPDPDPEPQQPETDYPTPDVPDNPFGTVTAPEVVGDIASQTNMDINQINKLGDALNNIKTDHFGLKVFNDLVNGGIKLPFMMQYGSDKIAYFSKEDNSIYFSRTNDIDSDHLFEELIHAAQYNLYYGEDMTNDARNFEFEAKVLQDMDCIQFKDGGCGYLGLVGMDDNKPYCDLYEKLIQCSVWDKQTQELYNSLGQIWDQYKGNFDSSISPNLIINYLK